MMVACMQEELIHSSFPKTVDDDLKATTRFIREKPQERNVFFAQQDEIFEIPHLDDLSDEEINDVWMSNEEFAAIRRECKKIIMIIQHDSRLARHIELRGLEHHMLHQQKATEALQELLYETVDRLLSFREESSMDVSDMLAEMCQKISSRSEVSAHKRGLKDEMIARSQ